ncbi:histidine phosphatase family protein [Acidothermaceae bacterium B102]|nr:histidine phosphatase family protein [Acidothermaceae bacterium B102]
MTTVLLLRHGRSTANAGGVLAGWTPDVHLHPDGEKQAQALAERLAKVPLMAVVSSPLDRCRETVAPLLFERDLELTIDDRFGEVRYGDWTGVELKKLAKDPLWPVVQSHPSGMTFPGEGGESMAGMQHRAVEAVRDWNKTLGDETTYLVCSHGDVIKAIVADALGMHLDTFQRINVDPASLTVIRYGKVRPFVIKVNDNGGNVDALIPPKAKRTRRKAAQQDAVVGGSTGAT